MVSLSFDQVHRMNKMLVYLFGALAGGVIESVSDALLFVLMSCLFVASIRFTHEFVDRLLLNRIPRTHAEFVRQYRMLSDSEVALWKKLRAKQK